MTALKLEPTAACQHAHIEQVPPPVVFGGLFRARTRTGIRCADCGAVSFGERTASDVAVQRRGGRPKGSGRVIPDASYLLRYYWELRDRHDRPITQQELADNIPDARDGHVGVEIDRIGDALRDFGLSWEEMPRPLE